MIATHSPDSRPTRDSRPGRRGAAAVEMAFIVPVLFLFVFGIIEFGRAWMLVHVMNEAARAGVRSAVAMNDAVAGTDWKGYIWTNVVQPALDNNHVDSSACTATWNTDPRAATGSTSTSTGYTPGDTITLTIAVQADKVTWMPLSTKLVGAGSTSYTVGFLAGKTLTVQYSLPKE